MKKSVLVLSCVILCGCANVSDKLSFEDLLSMYESKDFTTINNNLTEKGFIFRETNEGVYIWTKNLDYDFKAHNLIHPDYQFQDAKQNIEKSNCLEVIYGYDQIGLISCDYHGLDTLVLEIESSGYVQKEVTEDSGHAIKVLCKEGKPKVVVNMTHFPGTSTLIIGAKENESTSADADETEIWDFTAEKPNGWADLKVFLNNNPVTYKDENAEFYKSKAPFLWMACNIYNSLYHSFMRDSVSEYRGTSEAHEAMEFANDYMYLVNEVPLDNSSISTDTEEVAQKAFYDNKSDYDEGATEWKREYGHITYIIGSESHPVRGGYADWFKEVQYFNILEIWRGKDGCMYCKKGLLSVKDYRHGR